MRVGQTVSAGQQIGQSGNTGCSNPPHLHFAVVRLTNTASKRWTSVQFFTDSRHSNGTAYAIDPYGFAPPKGFDPWAWRAFPSGALSINLWKSGQVPSTGAW